MVILTDYNKTLTAKNMSNEKQKVAFASLTGKKKVENTQIEERAEDRQLTPEQENEYRTAQAAARNEHRGRPRKLERDEANNPIRDDGYRRTSMIVNIELAAKLKEIAFRSGVSEKSALEAAMKLAIEKYEEKHGEVIPNPSAYGKPKPIFD